MSERTFVMLKPETVARGQTGKVIGRIEDRGFKIVGLKILKLSPKQAERLYEMHVKKPFFQELIGHVTSGPIIVMVVEGFRVIEAMRKIAGSTNPVEAEAGSIRGSYGLTVTKNTIHTADGSENAKREIGIFFKPEEIIS